MMEVPSHQVYCVDEIRFGEGEVCIRCEVAEVNQSWKTLPPSVPFA